MKHDDLIKIASRWLKSKCAVVITEIATTGEEPDAIGFKTGETILIECKSSRADFLRDKTKSFRRNPEEGIGTYRYYMAPYGLIKSSELPAEWGLLEVGPIDSYVERTVKANWQKRNKQHEQNILISAFRRLGQKMGPAIEEVGMSVRFYTYETENRATLGLNLSTEEDENGGINARNSMQKAKIASQESR